MAQMRCLPVSSSVFQSPCTLHSHNQELVANQALYASPYDGLGVQKVMRTTTTSIVAKKQFWASGGLEGRLSMTTPACMHAYASLNDLGMHTSSFRLMARLQQRTFGVESLMQTLLCSSDGTVAAPNIEP
jgi:hypothetical protein